MEQLKPLSEFFNAISEDPRISVTHIGLYAAVLQYWREQHFVNPIHVYSHEIMKIAKISASTTYHKIIKELNEYGYLTYVPSFNRKRGSKIYVISTKEK